MRLLFHAYSILLAIGLFSLLPPSPQAKLLDKIVAVVNGDVITLSLLENQLRTEDYSFYGNPLQMRRMALEDLIEWKLMLQEAKRYGKEGFVLDEEIRKEREKWIDRLPPGVSFEGELKRLGLTVEDVDENIREQIMIAQMSYSKFFTSEPVSDAEAAAYYEEHKQRFVETWIQWEGIYFSIDPGASQSEHQAISEQAESIRNRLERGQEFDEIVRQLRENPEITIIHDSGPIILESRIPALRNALTRLEPSEWSHVIRTPIGFFLIRLKDKQKPHQKDFSEVEGSIKEQLLTQRIQSKRRAWLDKAKQDADIRILDPVLEATPINLQKTDLSTSQNAPIGLPNSTEESGFGNSN